MVGFYAPNSPNVIISALLYGLILSLLAELITVIINVFFVMFSCARTVGKSKNQGNKRNCGTGDFSEKPLSVSIVTIFSFGIAFLVLSYATLDGSLRLYPLLIMLAAYKTSEQLLFSKARVAFIQFIRDCSCCFSKSTGKNKNIAKKQLQFIKNVNSQSKCNSSERGCI